MADDEWGAVGGLHLSPMQNLTRPLVRLQATSERLSFQARFGLDRLTGPWGVDRARVREVRATHIWFSAGVEFHLDDGRLWVFWTGQVAEALRRLERLGYPLDRA